MFKTKTEEEDTIFKIKNETLKIVDSLFTNK